MAKKLLLFVALLCVVAVTFQAAVRSRTVRHKADLPSLRAPAARDAAPSGRSAADERLIAANAPGASGKVVSTRPTRSPIKPSRKPVGLDAKSRGDESAREAIRHRILAEMEATIQGSNEGSGFENWFYSQRAYPTDSIPLGARGRAIEAAIRSNGMQSGNRRAGPAVSLPSWIPIGPSTIPNGQTDSPTCCDKNGLPNPPLAPVSGRLTAIAVHPTDPNTVYVAGAQGGVWKTTNALAATPTWTPLTDHEASLAVGAIAIDPVNPNIIYVGTGEGNGSCDSYYGQGILRSVDGGGTWTLLAGGGPVVNNPGPFVGHAISKIIIDPATAGSATTTTVWASAVVGFGADGTYGVCNSPANPAVNGGLFRSTDSGATWALQDVPTGAGGTAQIHDLAVDPTSSNTLYAAVRAFPTAANGGVWKTTNAKGSPATFTRLAGGFLDTAAATPVVRRITLGIGGSGAPGTLYAAISTSASNLFGFYKTTNGGTNWSNVDGGFTGTCNVAGTSVTRVTGPSFVTGSSWMGRRFILNNTTALTVSSVTDGNTLTLTSSGGSVLAAGWSVAAYPSYCNGQCFYDMTIGVDPTDATGNTVYVGGNPNVFRGDTRTGITANQAHTLWRSTDGGATWFSVSEGDGTTGGIHTDDHVIAFDMSVTPGRVYNGNDGGIWRSNDQGASWTQMNTNIAITQFQGVSTHPSNQAIVLGGTQDNGTNLLNSTLQPPPAWFHSDFGDGGKSLVDQGTPLRMFHTYFNQTNNLIGPAKSVDGGVNGPGPDYYVPPGSWNFVGGYGGGTSNGITMADPVQFYLPLAQHPAFSPNVVYLGTSKVYRATDPTPPPGASWKVVSPALTKGGTCGGNTFAAALDAIAAFPSLIAGKEVLYSGACDGRIEVSSNVDGTGVAAWTIIDAAPLPNRAVTWIALDPTDATANTAYVTFSGFTANTPTTPGHVFKTVNGRNGGAATWTDISGDLPDIPTNQIALNPATTPATLYVGTDIGVFQSVNGGTNWTALSNGLPNVTVFGLERNPTTGQIVAATHGRGMFQLSVATALNFFTLPPCRIFDTRDPNGPLGGPHLSGQAERIFTLAGQCGVPITAQAVSVNLAVTGSTGLGHLIVYPAGVTPPTTAVINYDVGQTRSNNAIIPLSLSGAMGVFCGQAPGTFVDLILDVNGYFAP